MYTLLPFYMLLSLIGIVLDFSFFLYVIQHCFICRPSAFTVSEDAGIEPRTVATLALTARHSNHSARSHPHDAKLPIKAKMPEAYSLLKIY
jgi:hypothetical protein